MTDVFDRFPLPPSAAAIGWRLIEADEDEGTIRVGFEGKPEFCNPAGLIQGGFLTAMLDETMGPAVLVKSKGALFTASIGISVSFLAPARPGPLIGVGRIVRLGKTIAFLEADLWQGETMVARATSTARLVPVERAVGRGS